MSLAQSSTGREAVGALVFGRSPGLAITARFSSEVLLPARAVLPCTIFLEFPLYLATNRDWKVVSILQLLIILPIALINIALTAELALDLLAAAPRKAASEGVTSTLIIPANNEAVIIEGALAKLKKQLIDGMQILVVADNCDDDTAEIARSVSVQVIERKDLTRRGKGYALAYARHFLEGAPPQVVLILDADCETDGRSLMALVSAAATDDRSIQAVNLLKPDSKAHPLVQVSNSAFLLKNLFRQRGLQRISGAVHLTGTGMAFPWNIFRDASLATADLVEDLSLGLSLAIDGRPAQLLESAEVWSPSSSVVGTMAQRTRWEAGFLAAAKKTALPVIAKALTRGSPRAAWLGVNLLIPPLALLAALNVVAAAGAAALGLLGSSMLGFWLLLASAAGLGTVIAGVWTVAGKDFLAPRAMLMLPVYFAWKIPMYMRIAIRGSPRAWLRSGRGPEA